VSTVTDYVPASGLCYDVAMKNTLTFTMFLLLSGICLSALASENPQTPDTANLAEPANSPELARTSEASEASKSLSQQDKYLMKATFDGNLAQVQGLVAKGANVNSVDEKKRTPLIMAAYKGHTAVVEFLYGKGANINAIDSSGQNALMHACRTSSNETAAFLLKNGVEVNVQEKKRGVSALMIAAASGDVALVRMLLDHGADANLTDKFGRTAKGMAQKRGNSAVVDLLPDPPSPPPATGD